MVTPVLHHSPSLVLPTVEKLCVECAPRLCHWNVIFKAYAAKYCQTSIMSIEGITVNAKLINVM